MGILTRNVFLPPRLLMIMFFSRKKNDLEAIEDKSEAIKLNTINGVVNAKKILNVNGKHVVFVDQYGNVKEALLK